MSKQIDAYEIYKYLREKGLSDFHAIGVLANIQGESSLIPTAINKTSGAIGFFQFLGSRKQPFLDYMEKHGGLTNDNWKKQIDYLLDVEDVRDSRIDHYLEQDFPSSTDAVVWFGRQVERHGIKGENQKRATYAVENYSNFGNQWDTDNPNPKPTDDMIREDGTRKSDKGFLGPIINDRGETMTELSIHVDGNFMPALVPGLTTEEINQLKKLKKNESIPKSIIDKAVEHYKKRIAEGKSPFYNDKAEDTAPTTRNLIINKAPYQEAFELLKKNLGKLPGNVDTPKQVADYISSTQMDAVHLHNNNKEMITHNALRNQGVKQVATQLLGYYQKKYPEQNIQGFADVTKNRIGTLEQRDLHRTMTDLPNGIRQERDPNASLLSWVQQQLDMDILKGKQQKVNALEINPNQYDTSQLNLNNVLRQGLQTKGTTFKPQKQTPTTDPLRHFITGDKTPRTG